MPSKKTNLPPCVLIHWRDAFTEEANLPGHPVEPSLCDLWEIGWLAGETDEVVTFCMENESSSEAVPGRFRLHIPKSCIQSVQFLVPARKKPIKPQIIDLNGLPPAASKEPPSA